MQWLAHAILLSLLVAAFLNYFEKSRPFPPAFGPVADYLRTPVLAAMVFYTAGALMSLVGDAAVAVLRLDPNASPTIAMARKTIVDLARDLRIGNLNAPMELSFLLAILVVSVVLLIPALPLRRIGRVGRVIAFPIQATVYGALISVAGLLFVILVLATERDVSWLGYEAPALIVSLFYALIGVAALRKLFDLSSTQVLGIALIVALTALFPTEPLIHSPFGATIGENTRVWARFLFSSAADFTYVAALAGFAFRIARNHELDDRLVVQWLIFLLILQIALFAVGNPTETVAIAGVVAISSRWLLGPVEGRKASSDASANINWRQEEDTFPFIVGGAAAFVFLIQFIFKAGGNSQPYHFVLLGLAHVPTTFATGAVAALILSRGGACLRGDSATLKAVNISALILFANIAASLAGLQGRDRLFTVLANYLGVIASLIVCSMMIYDLQRTRTSDGRFEWRELFRGTTLAQAVPIVSALAVALFSALGPIVVHELGDAVGAIVKPVTPDVAPPISTIKPAP